MAGTTIDGLNSVTSLTAQDKVPVWDVEASGEPTKKITAQNMAASVKTLGSLVNTTEMNNALAGKQNTLTFDTTPTTGSTNPVTSGGIATAIQQSTAPLTVKEDLTVTYTQNQYVTSSDIGISVKRVGKAYAIDGNLWLSNEYSADSPVEICRIINYNAAKPIRMQIPNGANTMLITIYDNGIIALGRVTSSVARGWYRFGATAVKWD